ncbi:hypothetical protein [Catenulispora pinisilvae]|uniref:hypothetical protein n=1 Tax=Catenulispora pinisilvae TaxID=2705253 RepID=UPI0018924FDA|nr:hypothetical protein [Catenulispora pinisilvae]
MRRLEDVSAFLAQHSGARAIGQVPAMFGTVVTAAEEEFQQRLLDAGHSSSYQALLGLAVTVTFDTGGEAQRDQGEWLGYHRGLQTSLACLVMHETGCNPREAGLLVVQHTEKLIRCRWTTERPAEDGG